MSAYGFAAGLKGAGDSYCAAVYAGASSHDLDTAPRRVCRLMDSPHSRQFFQRIQHFLPVYTRVSNNYNCIKISRGNKKHNNHIPNSIPPQIPLSLPCVFFGASGGCLLDRWLLQLGSVIGVCLEYPQQSLQDLHPSRFGVNPTFFSGQRVPILVPRVP